MPAINTVDDFNNLVSSVEQNPTYQRPLAFGVGVATVDSENNLLDTFFPFPNYNSNFGSCAVLANILGHKAGTNSYRISAQQIVDTLEFFKPFQDDGKIHSNIIALKNILEILQNSTCQKVAVAAFIASDDIDNGPKEIPDAYLRLHLLSHRLVKPHGIKLNGIFAILPNVAWTNQGAISLKDLNTCQINAFKKGQCLTVHSVDKFPRMVDYVVPSGVRIADASRVRLGAYLGEGTTVMHEGFVNFNAGCEGPNMIEGRVSAGVFIKKGTDLGGGCSTMGTLSGGGNVVITIGEDCLVGANAGVGIALGKKCTIEAGLYVTAGTKVLFEGRVIKALELSGANNILFRRNSQTGQVEAMNRENTIALNEVLHT
jgi:2,3,4,5-tetrahydropyridine-2-carboxylate N-succinyltransferase